MIVDEGCKMHAYLYSYLTLKGKSLVLAGFNDEFGSIIASPGIAEKGHLNVRVEVTAPGGHSSIPPPHTVFVIFTTYIHVIVIISAEHWNPLRATCTL